MAFGLVTKEESTMKKIFIKVTERYTFHSFPVAQDHFRKLALFKICGIFNFRDFYFPFHFKTKNVQS